MSRQPITSPATTGGAGMGMGRAEWLAHQRGRKAVLYLIKLYGNEGEPAFYKVGITFNLSQRFRTLRFAGYKWRTIARFSSYNAGRVFDLEQRLHREFIGLRYRPLLAFSGAATECYASSAELLAALPMVGTFILKSSTDI